MRWLLVGWFHDRSAPAERPSDPGLQFLHTGLRYARSWATPLSRACARFPMPEFSLSTLAAVVEHLPVPVLLTTQSGTVVASSPASHAFVGAVQPGASFHGLLDHLSPVPSTTEQRIETDGDTHLIIAIDERTEAPPADVAELARATAHDFNNLLGVIINFASLAATQVPEGSTAAQDLQEVLVASRRAATLTRRLLQIAATAPDQYEQ
jgi:signal transduction histidine kinase